MLWNTYEHEKNYEVRSRELDRQWKLRRGEPGSTKKAEARETRKKRSENRREPQTSGGSGPGISCECAARV